jgi:hypothetical protein
VAGEIFASSVGFLSFLKQQNNTVLLFLFLFLLLTNQFSVPRFSYWKSNILQCLLSLSLSLSLSLWAMFSPSVFVSASQGYCALTKYQLLLIFRNRSSLSLSTTTRSLTNFVLRTSLTALCHWPYKTPKSVLVCSCRLLHVTLQTRNTWTPNTADFNIYPPPQTCLREGRNYEGELKIWSSRYNTQTFFFFLDNVLPCAEAFSSYSVCKFKPAFFLS